MWLSGQCPRPIYRVGLTNAFQWLMFRRELHLIQLILYLESRFSVSPARPLQQQYPDSQTNTPTTTSKESLNMLSATFGLKSILSPQICRQRQPQGYSFTRGAAQPFPMVLSQELREPMGPLHLLAPSAMVRVHFLRVGQDRYDYQIQ